MGAGLLGLLRALAGRGPRDEAGRFELLREAGRRLVPRYRFKWPQLAWWEDRAFADYLERFGEGDGLNADRRWMLGQLARLVAGVPGDTAECGAFRGAGSFLICSATAAAGGAPRWHHVFDSFRGLSAPQPVDGGHWRAGDLACGEEEVARALAPFPRVRLHPGWIPERFPDVADRVFAFVHVDVDLHDPTRDSLAFFYPRLSPGGIILCDDYGFTTCPGATRAVEDFLADKPEAMVALSGGGGFLVRAAATGPPPLGGAGARG